MESVGPGRLHGFCVRELKSINVRMLLQDQLETTVTPVCRTHTLNFGRPFTVSAHALAERSGLTHEGHPVTDCSRPTGNGAVHVDVSLSAGGAPSRGQAEGHSRPVLSQYL